MDNEIVVFLFGVGVGMIVELGFYSIVQLWDAIEKRKGGKKCRMKKRVK